MTVGFLLWWFSIPNSEVEKRKEQAAAAQWANSQTRTPNTGAGDPNGDVRMVFTSIRTPGNNEIPINGMAVALNGRGAVQGHVSGKNTGKRFFARTVSGVAAAAALGLGRSGGFSSPLSYGDLARERMATNIVNQGEQAINSLNQGENIIVSVPANTRFEIFLVSTVRSHQPPINLLAEYSET